MYDTPGDAFWAHQDVTAAAVIIRVGGAVDHATNDEFTECLRTAVATVTPPTPIVLDLTAVDFFGSSGLAALVVHHRRCADLGSPLRIVATQPAVLRPITLTGLLATLYVHPTRDQAVNAGQPDATP